MDIAEYQHLCAEYPSLSSLFSVIESLHDNSVIVGRDGVFLWVSSDFERTYGVTREEVVGRTTYELEAERIFFPSVAALVIKTRRVVTLTETSRSGQLNIVTGVPVYDNDGAVSLVVSYTIDPAYSLRLYDEYRKIHTISSRKEPPVSYNGVVYASAAMQKVLEKVRKVADLDTGVLITGESGVGKNIVARLLHHSGRRAAGPLVEINCAGIPDTLLESELFGYESGSFTGAQRRGKQGRIERAHGGTLFLDEIGEIPLHLQAKLLEVIQEKKFTKLGSHQPIDVDFRLVAATNQDLQALVKKKRFRSDLFFRLNIFPIHIPPLRERREDILPLCDFALRKNNEKYGTNKRISTEALDALQAYVWPGNIRELQNTVEQLVINTESDSIGSDDLPQHLTPHGGGDHGQQLAVSDLKRALENYERDIIRAAYRQHGTTVAVARALNISQPSAARKIARFVRS
jgi:PAS domain S-box-containing protein